MNTKPLFDPEPLRELRVLDEGNQAGLINGVIDMFTSTVEAVLADMQKAARANDAKTLGSLSHTMRSTSGNIGASRFSAICEELERIATFEKRRVQDEGGKLCRKLAEILPETLEILKKERS